MEYGLISEKDVILKMLAESHNQLRAMEITDRLMKRKDLKNDMNQDEQRFMGQNQAKMKLAKETIANLLEFLKDAKEEPELAKTIKDILE